MSSNTFQSLIERELKHWPEVNHAIERRKKHKVVQLSYRHHNTSVTFPSTPSDNVHGQKNMVAAIRQELKKLGASRLERPPVSKREVERAKVMASANDIKLTINPNYIRIFVPKGNKEYRRFVDSNDKPHGHWRFELRSNPDLKEDPFIAIVRTEMPPGISKQKGVYLPLKDDKRQKDTVFFQAYPGPYPEIMKIGMIPTTAVRVREHSNNTIVLELPKRKDRKGWIPPEQPKVVETKPAPVAKVPEKPKEQPKPVPIAKAPEPAPEPVPQPDIVKIAELLLAKREPVLGVEALAALLNRPEPKLPDKMQLVLPSSGSGLTVERAIDFLNKKKKEKGNNLRFTITDGGLLSYIDKGGPAH